MLKLCTFGEFVVYACDNLIIPICVSCFFLTHTVSLHVLFARFLFKGGLDYTQKGHLLNSNPKQCRLQNQGDNPHSCPKLSLLCSFRVFDMVIGLLVVVFEVLISLSGYTL